MTEALNHYLDQRDEDYERQGEEEEVSRLIDDQRRYNSDLIAELSDEIATRQRQTDELNNIIHHLEAEKATLKRDYCELVLAVGNKHQG